VESNVFKVNFEALLRLNPADNSLDSAAMDGRRAKSMSLLDLDPVCQHSQQTVHSGKASSSGDLQRL